MKTSPLLFSSAMVNALLDGTKTQTRRLVKPQPDTYLLHTIGQNGIQHFGSESEWYLSFDKEWWLIIPGSSIGPYKCPCGNIDDLIWVRESAQFCPRIRGAKTWSLQENEALLAAYMADGGIEMMNGPFGPHRPKVTPSIHMPRWASRITLRITDVRVQRLQDIGEEDAMAEGCFALWDSECTAARQYMELWKSIHGRSSWDLNPWVWAYTFDVIHKNVDEVLREIEL